MGKKEMNPNPTPKNVEEVFIILENIFDNYDGYDRRLKAYYYLNEILNKSDGEKQADTASTCNLQNVTNCAAPEWLTKDICALALKKWNEHINIRDNKRSEAIRIIQKAAKAVGITRSTKQCTRLFEQHCL